MECTLKRLGAVRTGDVGDSKFVKPIGIFYELDGKTRKWYSKIDLHVVYANDLRCMHPRTYIA
jgi:hypothetical protein